MSQDKQFSPDYPLGGQIEPYDIEREEEMIDEEEEKNILEKFNEALEGYCESIEELIDEKEEFEDLEDDYEEIAQEYDGSPAQLERELELALKDYLDMYPEGKNAVRLIKKQIPNLTSISEKMDEESSDEHENLISCFCCGREVSVEETEMVSFGDDKDDFIKHAICSECQKKFN